MPAYSALELSNLTKVFSEDIIAVDNVSIEVESGSIFGFLGPNGSGKSTTIRILTTLLKPTSGQALVCGIDLIKNPRAIRKKIGVALQEAGLDDLQTGRELVTLQGQLHGVNSSVLQKRVNRLFEVLDIHSFADRQIGTYSGGMKRRLDLASALVHEPELVFLDEPTTGLDPASREAIWNYVEHLNESKRVTIFLTTQYLEEADRLCRDLAIIDHGRVVARGSPNDLKADFGMEMITITLEAATERKTQIENRLKALDEVDNLLIRDEQILVYTQDAQKLMPSLVTQINELSGQITALSIEKPTLEDVFMGLTKKDTVS